MMEESRQKAETLTGQERFDEEAVIRRLQDQYSEIYAAVGPGATAAGQPYQEEWGRESMRYRLGDLSGQEYMETLQNKLDFWEGKLGEGVDAETQILQTRLEIQSLQTTLDQQAEAAAREAQKQIEEQINKEEEALRKIVGEPIVKELQTINDSIKDGFGREIEVEKTISGPRRSIVGEGLEFASTRRRAKAPITTRTGGR